MKKRYIISLILMVAAGLAMLLFRSFSGLFFPAYRNFSKALMSLLAWLVSFVPFAIWDILALLLCAAAIISLILSVKKKKSLLNWLSFVVLIAAIGLTEVVMGWMLNHYAPALSEDLGLKVEQYSAEELYETTIYLLNKAEEYAPLIERDSEGHAIAQDFYELAEIAGKSYETLSEEYPVFKGSTKPVKKLVLWGNQLLRDGFAGEFMPLTAEPSVPENDPPVPICFSMCHEAAHRLGFAAEEEANFCAFLACTNSKDPRFVYSAYYMAFSYCYSALYRESTVLAKGLYNPDSLLFKDRADTSALYSKYESPHQAVNDKINDTYLKVFDQEEGVKSYGMVVDYLIAYIGDLNDIR